MMEHCDSWLSVGVRSHPVPIMEVGPNDVDEIQDGHHILKYGAALWRLRAYLALPLADKKTMSHRAS